jgi:4-amino-4-deoxy-L-arabinose transferase-like glycosyltransferase
MSGVRPNAWLAAMAVFAVVVFLAGLNARQLWGADEPRIAGISSEIAVYGNWVQPRLNGEPFLETPPLFFWMDAISIKIFGQSNFAAKFPAALAAVAGVMAVFLLARNMGYSGFTALVCGGLLATSAQYWNNGRKCMTDMLLCAFIIFAMMAFQRLTESEGFRRQKEWFLLFALFLGGALMSKSLIGLAIPASALFFWLLIDNLYIGKKFTLSNWVYLFCGAALSFIPVAVWLWLLYCAHGYDAVYAVVWTNNFGRFLGSHAEHVEPFYYYLKKLPEQFQPWTILLPFALIFHFIQAKTARNRNSLFMLCWLLIPYILLSAAAGKRQVYVLPLYAAEAMMIGAFIGPIVEGTLKLPGKINVKLIIRLTAAILAAIICVSPLVLFIVARILKQPVFASDNLMLCLLAAAGLILFGLFGRYGRHPELIAAGIFFGMAINYVAIDAVILKARNPVYSLDTVFNAAARETEKDRQLYLYCPSERVSGGAVFYFGKKIPSVSNAGALEKIRSEQGSDKAVFLAYEDAATALKNIKIIYESKVKKDDMVLFKFGDRK